MLLFDYLVHEGHWDTATRVAQDILLGRVGVSQEVCLVRLLDIRPVNAITCDILLTASLPCTFMSSATLAWAVSKPCKTMQLQLGYKLFQRLFVNNRYKYIINIGNVPCRISRMWACGGRSMGILLLDNLQKQWQQ